jgi:Uri superfamily endonuclease
LIGSYVLALWLDAPHTLHVGRLGALDFPAGWYLYAGSARGPGGLPARLARHGRRLGPDKRARWHIDYLREQATWGGAWGCAAGERQECAWAAALRGLPGAQVVATGFGSSDCRCPTHLVYVSVVPNDDWFSTTLGAKRIAVKVSLEDLLKTLTCGDDESREAAVQELSRLGDALVEPLAALLTGAQDAEARWWAARALAEIGGEAAVGPLVQALDDAESDVRACAALALGHIGAGSAAPALAARLADDSAFVAGIAADALSMIGPPAMEALTASLQAPQATARLLAVRALGRIGAEQAVEPLCRLLDDPSYLVRYHVEEALEALGVGMVYVAP